MSNRGNHLCKDSCNLINQEKNVSPIPNMNTNSETAARLCKGVAAVIAVFFCLAHTCRLPQVCTITAPAKACVLQRARTKSLPQEFHLKSVPAPCTQAIIRRMRRTVPVFRFSWNIFLRLMKYGTLSKVNDSSS